MDDHFSEVAADVRAYIDSEFSAISRQSTRIRTAGRDGSTPDLFHYTNAEAARLILDSRSLWATHVQFLNDASEFCHGVERAKKCLALANSSATEDKRKFMLHAEQLFEEVLNDEGSKPYVVAFSADGGDRLSQWRAYGDGGSGFSLGFDYENLARHFGDFARVLPVTYDEDTQKEILTYEIEQSWIVHENATHRWAEDAAVIDRYCQSQLVTFLWLEPAAFKHPGFREEQEFRLVTSPLQPGCPKGKFRAGKFGIVPYVELRAPTGKRLPVEKVFQGPTPDRFSAKRGIEMLVADLGYLGVKVAVSELPLR